MRLPGVQREKTNASQKEDSAPTHVGTFRIHRRGYSNGECTQFEPQMWAALSDPISYLHRAEHLPCEQNVAEIESSDVEMLLSVLRTRLIPFATTASIDSSLAAGAPHGSSVVSVEPTRQPWQVRMKPEEAVGAYFSSRSAFVAMYRDGQRRVLEQAIETLQTMLAPDSMLTTC